MRISYWSSNVCSSDLHRVDDRDHVLHHRLLQAVADGPARRQALFRPRPDAEPVRGIAADSAAWTPLPKFGTMPIMAAKNTSVALGEPFIEFARRKVESGEVETTSEVVREAMRSYVAKAIELPDLRAAIREGLESGPPSTSDCVQLRYEKHP